MDDKVKKITETLEKDIQSLFQSEKYQNYLKVMSKFHNYSFNNSLLIAMQRPDATMVAGFGAWIENFSRHVKKGEKGIKIIAPSPYKKIVEEPKIDPVSRKTIIGKDGQVVMEKVEKIIPSYKVTTVFDISQTDGEDLPEVTKQLTGSVEEYEKFYDAIKKCSPVPIEISNVDYGCNGFYHLSEKKIVIKEGLSQQQMLKTIIHELAHAKLHDKDTGIEKDDLPDKRTKEVEAESIAYTVCQHFGIDTSEYSFGYIAGWSNGKELDELKNSMKTIRSTASEIIRGIEKELYLSEEKEKKLQQQPEKEPEKEKQQQKQQQKELHVIVGKRQYHRAR